MTANIEIKAKSSEEQQNKIRQILRQNNARYIGTDFQTDTYFKFDSGRFKLRKGNIENYLIYYKREDKKQVKLSEVTLIDNQGRIDELEKRIKKTYDIFVIVKKQREIYLINNIKFHIDDVSGLGRFIEIEAISKDGNIAVEKLKKQCEYYKNLFKIENENLIEDSYSEILMKTNKNGQI